MYTCCFSLSLSLSLYIYIMCVNIRHPLPGRPAGQPVGWVGGLVPRCGFGEIGSLLCNFAFCLLLAKCCYQHALIDPVIIFGF